MLKPAERIYGPVKAFAWCLFDKRAPNTTRHSLADLVGQRIFGIACGHAGVEESALFEIEVRARRRVIRRRRWRRSCAYASSPAEVSAPPAPRLFDKTPYGTSVWSRVLYERYACLRPLQRLVAWLGDQGLPV